MWVCVLETTLNSRCYTCMTVFLYPLQGCGDETTDHVLETIFSPTFHIAKHAEGETTTEGRLNCGFYCVHVLSVSYGFFY